jgi:hypothetical protein
MHTIIDRGPAKERAHSATQLAVDAFRQKFQSARPGTPVPYYTGFLCHDSYGLTLDNHGKEVTVPVEPAKSLGDAARELYWQGRAELVQRRLAEGVFQYVAVKRRAKAWRRRDPE